MRGNTPRIHDARGTHITRILGALGLNEALGQCLIEGVELDGSPMPVPTGSVTCQQDNGPVGGFVATLASDSAGACASVAASLNFLLQKFSGPTPGGSPAEDGSAVTIGCRSGTGQLTVPTASCRRVVALGSELLRVVQAGEFVSCSVSPCPRPDQARARRL